MQQTFSQAKLQMNKLATQWLGVRFGLHLLSTRARVDTLGFLFLDSFLDVG
jgi:hypothetical protein